MGTIRWPIRACRGASGIIAPPDLQESFNIGPIHGGATPYFTEGYGAIHFAPNRWPETPKDFRTQATRYYEAMERVSWQLMRIFAMALGMEETFFDDKIDRHVSSLRSSTTRINPRHLLRDKSARANTPTTAR